MIKRKSYALWTLSSAIALAGFLTLPAQARPFAPGARVAFVGDSITHHGQYLRYLNLFYATRFPCSGIRLFNCGINGDATGAVQMRLDEDVCALNPTDVSFMLGMNDANSERMAESYEPNFRKVVEIVRTGCPDVRFHWMLPTIYDATSTAGTTNNAVWRAERVNDVAVPAMRRLAKETDGRILDVNGDMRMWTARLQAEDPKASLVSGDRCHPDRRGGFFIAWSYLRNQCVEPCLDRIVRDAEGKDALTFTLTEKALPYPVDPAAGDLAAKLPLDQICREELKVVNLVPGRYTLILDGQPVGTYSSEALARGVDLARTSATPQYRQALEVLKLVDARNDAEVHYRNLVWVWRMLKIRKIDFADAKAVRGYYESQSEKARKTGWLKFVPEWLEQWPRRADILADLERRMREIERVARPISRRWELRSVSDDFALVRNGQPACALVATGNKTVDADIAFFTNAVARISGAELVVVESGSCRKDVADSALPLQLGTTTNRIVFEIREADLFHEDDYEIMFPDAKTMRIVGTDQSCRWALNRLLEEKGVVFCSAGPHGTHWPQAKDLSFSFERRVSPDVTIRLERDLYVEDPAWQRSMGGKKQKGRFFWHNMCDMFPLSKYGREPWLSKLMPEKNGRRACPKEQEVGWQPCYASEEGIAETVRIICDHLDRHPEEKVYSLAVNDHEGYCECAACKKLNGGTFETKSAYMVRYRNFSPAYYSWVNRVAKGVAKRHPHVVLGLLAYCGVIDPPPFRLEPNVVPYFCYDIQQLSDEKTRANRLKLMGKWSKVAKSIGIWDYSFGCPGYACFREYPDEQALFFGLKKTVCPALDGFFTEGQGTYFSSEWRRRYLYLRLAFDASRDPAAELDRWYRACVGEAAAADLKAYYGVWDGFWRSPALKATNWYKHGVMGPYFAYEDKQPLFALDAATRKRADALMTSLLAKAEASGTDDQRIRARKLKHMHDYYAMKQVECLYGLTGAGEKVTREIAEEYLRRIPEAEAARQRLPALLEKVCADALDGTNIYVKGRVAQVRRLSANNSNKTLLMNGALQQVGAKRLAEAMGYRLEDVNIAHIDGVSAWTLCKRGLEVAEAESVNGTSRWKLTANDFWWKAGYACVTGLVPRCSYAVSARVTNPLARPVNVTVGLNSSMPPHWRPSDLGTFASTTLKAGETKTVTALHTLHPKTSAGKILISIGGLKPGEHVFADSISLKTFGSADGTTPLN